MRLRGRGSGVCSANVAAAVSKAQGCCCFGMYADICLMFCKQQDAILTSPGLAVRNLQGLATGGWLFGEILLKKI